LKTALSTPTALTAYALLNFASPLIAATSLRRNYKNNLAEKRFLLTATL
jgi:hypothetical protein